MRRPVGRVTCKRSPGRTCREGLAACSLTSTRPPSQAAAARLRVLKNRAAHSHLSRRRASVMADVGYDRDPKRHLARARRLAADLVAIGAPAWAAEVVIEDWQAYPFGSRGLPKGWKEQSWGRPTYALFSIAEENGRALHMKSRGESSSIAREISVNLKATPILEW